MWIGGEVELRLIDADALKVRIMEDVPGFLDGGSSITKAFILAMLGTRNATPTIDAVPIVRCKDCRYYHGKNEECGARSFYPPSCDWFCADGEKDEGQMKRPKETFWDSMSEAELIEPMHHFQD
jgi:hypothetical protein